MVMLPPHLLHVVKVLAAGNFPFEILYTALQEGQVIFMALSLNVLF
jgi:hypothetical protein